MIVRPREHWLRMLFVWRGSVLRIILPQMLFMLVVSLLALFTQGRIFGERVTLSFTVIGLTLAVFLGFRNNVSYARYWEARQLWGHIATVSRSLMSQVICYLDEDEEGGENSSDRASARDEFLRHLVAFPYALNWQLRGLPNGPLPGLSARENQALSAQSSRPMALLHRLRRTLARLHAGGRLDAPRLWLLDRNLEQLSDHAGGCERIAATPFPYSYGVLMHRTVFVYCMLLPFGLVEALHELTPFVSLFISYSLLALEEISHEIADPFGTAQNDLALDAISRNIERSLLELAGRPVPEALGAGPDFVLR